jgi:WG containing repeat
MLICINVLTLTAHPQPRGERPLRGDQNIRQPSYFYPVTTRDKTTTEKKIGFINNTGKLVIGFDRSPKRIEGAFEFHEGRAAIYVTKEKVDPYSKYYAMGYIDETGEVVIAPRFDEARDFSEGLAYVTSKEFRGFIDRHGKAVIKLDSEAKDFHEGLAAVKGSGLESGWGYMDRSGRWVVKPQYQVADDFSEGLAQVMVDRKFGFINKKGEMIIPPRFDVHEVGYTWLQKYDTSRFSEGLACVAIGDLFGYINKKGDFVIPPQFSRAQEFSEGLAWVTTKGIPGVVNKVGWIDKSGRWALTEVDGRALTRELPGWSTYISPYKDWRYSEGLVPFFVYEGHKALWGYMDRKGKVVIKPILVLYEAYGVSVAGTCCESKMVIEPRGHEVGPFLGGIARVDFYSSSTEKAYGYINKKGQFIWRSW